jgi:hypothetical protein
MTAEGTFPKVNGDVFYASESNTFNYDKIAQVQVKTTKLTCSDLTGYLYWTAGTISIGATDYTLSASNSGADWRGTFVIATLSGGTATLSSVAVTSKSSMAPSTVVALCWIDSAGLITHFFSNTQLRVEEIDWVYSERQTSGTLSKTLQVGSFNTGDGLELTLEGAAGSQASNGSYGCTVRITDNGGDHNFSLWSGNGITELTYRLVIMNIKDAKQSTMNIATTLAANSFSTITEAISFPNITAIAIVLTNVNCGSTAFVNGFSWKKMRGS